MTPSSAGSLYLTAPYPLSAISVYNVKDYGAVCDGVTDDTTKIQAAIDAAYASSHLGAVLIPGPAKVKTLQAKPHVAVVGQTANPDSNVGASALIGTSGYNIFEFATATGDYAWFRFSDLNFDGGLNHLYSAEIVTHLVIDRCAFTNPTASAIGLRGAIEQSSFNNCLFSGGAYGFRMENVNNTRSSLNYVDKTVFQNCTFESQTTNAVRIEATNLDVVSFYNPVIHTTSQHGVVIDGSARSVAFYNPYVEGVGQAGKNARTTGSISASSQTLTVADATGFTIGDPITVAGAGVSRADLTTTITNIVGTTFTLNAAAGVTVSSVPVTNASYDEFVFSSGISGTPARISFFGGRIGNEGSGGKLRYPINATGAVNVALFNTECLDLYVYDPDYAVTLYGGAGWTLRRPFDGGWAMAIPSGMTQLSSLSAQQFLSISGATPSVSGGNLFFVTQGGATTVTNLTSGVHGQEVTLIFLDGNSTLQRNGNLLLAGGVNFSATSNDVITLVYSANAGAWFEKSRSVN